jgi:hypothetical protein
MVGGIGVCHLVGHGHGGSGGRRAEAADERLWIRQTVEGGDCYGGGRGARGGVNEGATCCTGKPYCGVMKKAFYADPYGAPPMDGSKNEQARALTLAMEKGSMPTGG